MGWIVGLAYRCKKCGRSTVYNYYKSLCKECEEEEEVKENGKR